VQTSADFVAPETLGFESGSEGWRKTVGERRLLFARLRSRLDLEKTERLQRAVFGVSDRDLASSSILVAVHETGGEVLGAFDGERLVGFDLYPYTEDQVGAVRRAIVQWEFIWDLARKIDREALNEARANADALTGQKAVYRALGLDADYEAEIIRRRKEARAAGSEAQA
jgi:hypothetical protein